MVRSRAWRKRVSRSPGRGGKRRVHSGKPKRCIRIPSFLQGEQETGQHRAQGLAQELAGRCTGPGGARQLRRLVQTQVEDKLAAYLLRSGRKPVKIRLRIEEGEVVLT